MVVPGRFPGRGLPSFCSAGMLPERIMGCHAARNTANAADLPVAPPRIVGTGARMEGKHK